MIVVSATLEEIAEDLVNNLVRKRDSRPAMNALRSIPSIDPRLSVRPSALMWLYELELRYQKDMTMWQRDMMYLAGRMYASHRNHKTGSQYFYELLQKHITPKKFDNLVGMRREVATAQIISLMNRAEKSKAIDYMALYCELSYWSLKRPQVQRTWVNIYQQINIKGVKQNGSKK